MRDTIEMAFEAGLHLATDVNWMPIIGLSHLKAFEALVRADERALAQPVQEPVAWISHNAGLYHFKPDESLDPLPLYLAPPAAQPAPVQEPVAAECKFDREKEWGRCTIEHHKLVQSEPQKWPGYQTRLLYTTPPAAPVQEFVCSTGLCHYKPAAQRQWVGLTDEEIRNWWRIENGLEDCQLSKLNDFTLAVRAIETKLREKNGGQP